jgi:hypothetical protein
MGYLIGLLIIVAVFYLVALSVRAKDKRLRAAPPGSSRIEVIKATSLKHTVAQYSRAGWIIVDQSSAKSFGSQARVTITFRKHSPAK